MLQPPFDQQPTRWRRQRLEPRAARWGYGLVGTAAVGSAIAAVAGAFGVLPLALSTVEIWNGATPWLRGAALAVAVPLAVAGGRWLHAARTGRRPGSWRAWWHGAVEASARLDLPDIP